MSSFSFPKASTSATRAPEASTAAGLATGSATPGQTVWLGQCAQTASYHQVLAGDSKGRSPADETAEGAAATTASCCHATDPHSNQNCTCPLWYWDVLVKKDKRYIDFESWVALGCFKLISTTYKQTKGSLQSCRHHLGFLGITHHFLRFYTQIIKYWN